jgi:hypothetical protein
MAGLLQDSVEQGQSAFAGLGAAAEQAAANQMQNQEVRLGLQEGLGALVGTAGGMLISRLNKRGEVDPKKPQQQPAGTSSDRRGPLAMPASYTPGAGASGDSWSQMLGSVQSRYNGGLLHNTAVPMQWST